MDHWACRMERLKIGKSQRRARTRLRGTPIVMRKIRASIWTTERRGVPNIDQTPNGSK